MKSFLGFGTASPSVDDTMLEMLLRAYPRVFPEAEENRRRGVSAMETAFEILSLIYVEQIVRSTTPELRVKILRFISTETAGAAEHAFQDAIKALVVNGTAFKQRGDISDALYENCLSELVWTLQGMTRDERRAERGNADFPRLSID